VFNPQPLRDTLQESQDTLLHLEAFSFRDAATRYSARIASCTFDLSSEKPGRLQRTTSFAAAEVDQ